MGLPDTFTSKATQPGGTGTAAPVYIASVHLLCAECRQPIKATITTAQWLKVEWISPDGTCQACWQLKKQETKDAVAK